MSAIWKIAPGQGADNWDICHRHGCIVIGWGGIGDLERYRNQKEVLRALKREYGNEKGCGSGAARTIWRFVHVIETSDVVVANKGANTVVGLGRITSEYLHAEHRRNPVPVPDEGEWWRRNARLVDWRIQKPVELPKKNFFVASTIQRLTADQYEEIKLTYVREFPGLKGRLDELFSGISVPDNHSSTTAKLLTTAEKQLEDDGDFDSDGTTDDRERILSSIVRRRGQPAFRRKLLMAYKGRCAITGCDVEAVLEAAHIVPYKGAKTNHPGNGLLLRADLHTLFDLGLLAVDIETMRLVISPSLRGTGYEEFRGKRIRIPKRSGSQPSRDALQAHCRECGLSK